MSKSKRVKNYLSRKCRDVLGEEVVVQLRSRSASRRRADQSKASWYVEDVVDSRTEGGGCRPSTPPPTPLETPDQELLPELPAPEVPVQLEPPEDAPTKVRHVKI
jgi:hypothetical protein